ncbi:MAG: hypothetical protein SOV21_00725 [Methanosphaera sp.]|nr:hypothetical protein [Methanosphaera sp.]
MIKNAVGVILPTYNRYQRIKNLCEQSFCKLEGSIFNIYILDSSDNDDTKNLVETFNINAKKKINYKKIDPTISADLKVRDGILSIQEEYVYVCGDGIVIDFNELEKKLFKNNVDFSVVDIETYDRIGYLKQDANMKQDTLYYYENKQEYVAKYFSHLTFWGGSIAKTDLLKKAIIEKYNDYAIEKTTWWLPCLLVECINYSDKKMAVIYSTAISPNSAKTNRSWDKGEDYYKIVFSIFNKNISSLPHFVNNETKYKITKFFRDDCLVNNRYLLSKRIDGSINLKLSLKYKDDIKVVRGYYYKFIILSLTPRWNLYIIRFVKKCISKTVKMIIRRK